MATNTVNGVLVCSDGTNVPLKAELAEGTETNLTTDTAYTVTAQNVGDYALGKVVTSGLITSDNGIAYAYILRQGLVAALIPVGIKGAAYQASPLCALGDTIQGQMITKAAFNSVDGAKIETQGAFIVNSKGNVVGSVPAVNPSVSQPVFQDYRIPVELNFQAQFLTNA